MSFVVADRVKETTTVAGTGAISLGGAPTGYQPFSTIGNGNSTFYSITFGNSTQWETGIGTYNSATNTLSRDTVLTSSNANSLVNFFTGNKTVLLTQPSSRAVYAVGGNIVAANGATLPISSGGTGGTTASTARAALDAQQTLASGTNIKTVNSTSLLGSGNIAVQPTLVSGTSIKTINNTTLLGSGDLAIPTLTGITEAFPTGELTALGFGAGGSSFGGNTTFIGYNTGRVNSSGYDNTAVGATAMFSNTSGFKNTAIGAGALFNNTNGDNNIAIGNALALSVGGDNNIAIGDFALRSTSGNDVYSCVAMGISALRDNTTGMDNTAIGHYSGYQGANPNTTGSNNTFLGNGAVGASSSSSNAVTLGNSSIATLRCQVTTITSLSDARDKTNIVDIPAGLSFVQALRPVAFDWNMRDGGKIGVHEFGFIAQELQAAQNQTGITVPNLLYTDNPEKLEASAGTLIPVLVKAIQELKQQFDDYKASHP
jgi:hypothetical protein